MSEFKCVTKRLLLNEKEDYSYEIAPDKENMGLVEIVYKEHGVIKERTTYSIEVARQIADAIVQCANEIEDTKEN